MVYSFRLKQSEKKYEQEMFFKEEKKSVWFYNTQAINIVVFQSVIESDNEAITISGIKNYLFLLILFFVTFLNIHKKGSMLCIERKKDMI